MLKKIELEILDLSLIVTSRNFACYALQERHEIIAKQYSVSICYWLFKESN